MAGAVGLMRWFEWHGRLRINGCLKWKRPKIGEGISMPLEDNGVLVPDFDFVAVKNGATAVVAE